MVAPSSPTPAPTALGGEFRKLWASSAVSNLGDGVALVAAPLLAATLTDDPRLIAGLSFAQQLPWLLFALVSGALADRLDRRIAMAVVGISRALLFGVLGLAVFLGQVSLPLLYAVFFLLSTGETLFDTASTTVLPALVPKEALPRANARLSGTTTVTNYFIGKPLGGFLFATAAALPFWLGASGLILSAMLLLTLRGVFRAQPTVDSAPTTFWIEIVQGLRWLWQQRLLRTIAVTLAIFNVTFVAWNSILVLIARDRLGLGPTGFGMLLTGHALGAVAGSFVAGRIVERFGASRILRFALLIEIGTPIALALTDTAALAGAALAIFGCHALIWGTVLVSLRQELTPVELRGRVEGAYRFLEYGGAAPGALLGGLLAARFGLTAPFWLGAIVGLLLLPFVWPVFSAATVAAARSAAEVPVAD